MIQRYHLHRISALITAALWVGAFLLTGCDRKPEAPAPRDTPPRPVEKTEYEGTIVAMGDSLTEGYGLPRDRAYPALLEEKLQAEGFSFQVINAGISGETSSGTRSRTEWMLSLKPDIVILETGANDGLRGVDPEVTRENIAEIIRILQKNDVVVVLAGMRMVRNLGREYTDAFSGIYPALAEQFEVIFIPFFLEGVAGDPTLNQEDSIHPNAEGYRVLVNHIHPQVVKAIRVRRARSSED
ncbi:MAG: arylesterase [Thermodesulfobacteriota bacterium]